MSAFFILHHLLDIALVAAKNVDPSTLYEGGKYFNVDDPSFYDIAQVMSHSEDSMGYGKTCPRDGKPNCSLVDALNMEGQAGPANLFCSWVWRYKVRMFIETFRAWFEETGKDAKTTFIWICFFCNNQYRIQDGNADDLEVVFEERLKRCGRVVAVIDQWDTPLYVTRIWTMFEQFSATKLEVPMTMIMPPDQTLSFNQMILEGQVQTVKASLTNIDVENCEASVSADLVKVMPALITHRPPPLLLYRYPPLDVSSPSPAVRSPSPCIVTMSLHRQGEGPHRIYCGLQRCECRRQGQHG